MNTKKIIIILVFVAIIVAFLSVQGKSQNNNDKSTKEKDDTMNPGNGTGYDDHKEGIVVQSKMTMSQAQLDYVVNTIHKLFDWTFSDDEFRQFIQLIQGYVFSRADMQAIMQADNYVNERIYSWIINDPNRTRLTQFNQALASNGVELQYTRTIK